MDKCDLCYTGAARLYPTQSGLWVCHGCQDMGLAIWLVAMKKKGTESHTTGVVHCLDCGWLVSDVGQVRCRVCVKKELVSVKD